MKIVDLTAETIDDSISLCIGSKPGDELAREEKRRWLESRIPLGAGGKLAYHDNQLAGMIEFTPIEESPFPVTGKELLHINCLWVLPRFQRNGIGEGLLRACLQEAKHRGMKGVSVLAYDNPLFMPLSFFYRQGFRSSESRGSEELMWMSLEASKPPKFLTNGYSPKPLPIGYSPEFLPMEYSPKVNGEKVVVDILYSAQCPWSIKGRQRIEKVAREFGGAVQVRSSRADNREKVEQMGDSKRILVDGKEIFLPTPAEDDVRRVLANRISQRQLSS